MKDLENYWEKDDWLKIINAFEEWKQKPKEANAQMIYLATAVTLYTGSRIGEVIGMRKRLIDKYNLEGREKRIIKGVTPADINFIRRYIVFQMEKKNPISVYGKPRKEEKETEPETIRRDIPNWLADQLKAYIDKQGIKQEEQLSQSQKEQ